MLDKSETEFSPLTAAIVDKLVGLKIMEADLTLDEARRAMWAFAFSGASPAVVVRTLGLSAPARGIVGLLNGRTLLALESVFLEARLYLWMQHFGRVEGSRFGQQFTAHIERQALPGDRAKLN